MLWFLATSSIHAVPIGSSARAGAVAGLIILAASLGIWFGTLLMAFHATQGPVVAGLPQ